MSSTSSINSGSANSLHQTQSTTPSSNSSMSIPTSSFGMKQPTSLKAFGKKVSGKASSISEHFSMTPEEKKSYHQDKAISHSLTAGGRMASSDLNTKINGAAYGVSSKFHSWRQNVADKNNTSSLGFRGRLAKMTGFGAPSARSEAASDKYSNYGS